MAGRIVRWLMTGVALAGAGSAFAQTGPVTLSVTTPPPAASTPTRGAAWKLLAGYQLGGGFGLEAAWGDAPRHGVISGLSAAGDVRMRAWSFSGLTSYPLDRRWAVTGKVGVGSSLSDLSRLGVHGGVGGLAYGAPGNRTDVLWGLGLGYSVGRGFGLRFEYENYSLGGTPSGARDQWAVSLKYSF
jgi:hypothetical protein